MTTSTHWCASTCSHTAFSPVFLEWCMVQEAETWPWKLPDSTLVSVSLCRLMMITSHCKFCKMMMHFASLCRFLLKHSGWIHFSQSWEDSAWECYVLILLNPFPILLNSVCFNQRRCCKYGLVSVLLSCMDNCLHKLKRDSIRPGL